MKQIPSISSESHFIYLPRIRRVMYALIAAVPLSVLANQPIEDTQERVLKTTAGEASLSPAAEYLNRSNAAPYILKVLLDQHSKRNQKTGTDEFDYVYIGSLQSVLSSLNDARDSLVSTQIGKTSLTKKQMSLLGKLKATAKSTSPQETREKISEAQLLDAIALEIRDIAPLVREYYAEESLQKSEGSKGEASLSR